MRRKDIDHELIMQFLLDLHVVLQLTFISSRFGGRHTGLVPPEGVELCWLRLLWLEGAVELAATVRGGEEVVMELEEEEEDGCWSVWALLYRNMKEMDSDLSSQTTEGN